MIDIFFSQEYHIFQFHSSIFKSLNFFSTDISARWSAHTCPRLKSECIHYYACTCTHCFAEIIREICLVNRKILLDHLLFFFLFFFLVVWNAKRSTDFLQLWWWNDRIAYNNNVGKRRSYLQIIDFFFLSNSPARVFAYIRWCIRYTCFCENTAASIFATMFSRQLCNMWRERERERERDSVRARISLFIWKSVDVIRDERGRRRDYHTQLFRRWRMRWQTAACICSHIAIFNCKTKARGFDECEKSARCRISAYVTISCLLGHCAFSLLRYLLNSCCANDNKHVV